MNGLTELQFQFDSGLIPAWSSDFVSSLSSVVSETKFHTIRAGERWKPGWAYTSETTGWKATCECNAEKVPAVILDHFSGSGTTPIIAQKTGRDFYAIDLSKEYVKLSNKRLYNEFGMFL